MNTIARFIGIDKYHDSGINNLGGAARDAIALWALFKDTIPEIDDQLLINDDADYNSLNTAVIELLRNAKVDDNIIITFSGHGSINHRIITCDTKLENEDKTSLSMDDLSIAFKSSKAKSILILLDCCFSGAAPAKVIELDYKIRSSRKTEYDFSGKGRVIVTASGFKEEAFENNTLGHGILTYSFVEAFKNFSGKVGLSTLLDKVMLLVKENAESIGQNQTPVFINYTEGSFSIPALKKGKNYYEKFPDISEIKIGNQISELTKFGIPDSICAEFENYYGKKLLNVQLTAINQYRVLNGESTIVVAPTSSGKTFVGELSAIKAVTSGFRAIFLLPYKALVNEKYDQFEELYGKLLDLNVIRCSGDYLDQTDSFLKCKFDIAILTYEMFLTLLLGNKHIINNIGTIVLDELQFISDATRGIVVELILSYLRSLKRRPQLILLSATIGSINQFDEWLDISCMIENKRPVPLEFGVINRAGNFRYVDNDGNEKHLNILASNQVIQRGKKASSQDIIVPLVRKILSDNSNEKILIFRNKKGSTEGCANYLANDLPNVNAEEILNSLPKTDMSNTSGTLRRTLQSGVAFHNTNLSREERVEIEKSFRNPDSPINVIVATSTLAAGINTPASTVIIVENSFTWENQKYQISFMKNMAGRAGRLGFQETGKAILLANNHIEFENLYAYYVKNEPEPIESSFKDSDLGTWIIRLLTQVECLGENEIPILLSNTYGGFLNKRKDPNWEAKIQSSISDKLTKMLKYNLLEKEDSKLRLTILGSICGQSSISLDSCIRLLSVFEDFRYGRMSSFELVSLSQILNEMDTIYVPLFKKGQREQVWPSNLSTIINRDFIDIQRRFTSDMFVYLARAKKVCILNDWINGAAISEIEAKYTVNAYNNVGAGDIRGIANSNRFHLRSVYNILSIKFPDLVPKANDLDDFLKQLEVGIPLKAISLLDIPVQFDRGDYLALIENNIYNLENIKNQSDEHLTQILGRAKAMSLLESAKNTS